MPIIASTPTVLSLSRWVLTPMALALGLLGTAQAQSLKELYDAARSYDASYLAAKSLADSAVFKAAQADAVNRPAVALSSGVTATSLDIPHIGSGDSNAITAAAKARYPLFNRTNDLIIAQARKALEIAQADLETAEQDLIVRAAQAYFDVLAAQDNLNTTRASKVAITEQLASAKRNFEVGTATITDTREAQARYDLSVAQELAAENDLRTKKIALDQLVGRNGFTPKPLAVPVVLPSVLPPDVDVWVTTADNQHPTVRKARLGLDAASLELKKSRAADLPTLDAVGGLNLSRASGSSATTPGLTKSASVGVELNYTLYNGGQTDNRIKETVSLEEKARNDLEAARRGVAQGTRVAYFGVQSGLSQVKALEAAESSTKLALEATQLGYKVGVRVNLDVLNAQTQLYQTQRDLAKGRYDVILGGLKLRQASGQLQPQDVANVNVLLAP